MGTSFGAGGGEHGQGEWVVRAWMQVERDSDEASAAAFYPLPHLYRTLRSLEECVGRVFQHVNGVLRGGRGGFERPAAQS